MKEVGVLDGCLGRMCQQKNLGGMEFRRIKDFNIAMLGKSGWIVMTRPQTFIAKLLKARYFPNYKFREANLGRNPSYVWHSILTAKDLILAGSVLKVGKRDDITVWTEPWIPETYNKIITTPVIPGLENIKVCSLFREDQREWDCDIIRDIFNTNDVDRISIIPFSNDLNAAS